MSSQIIISINLHSINNAKTVFRAKCFLISFTYFSIPCSFTYACMNGDSMSGYDNNDLYNKREIWTWVEFQMLEHKLSKIEREFGQHLHHLKLHTYESPRIHSTWATREINHFDEDIFEAAWSFIATRIVILL